MLVGQAWLECVVERIRVLLLQRQHLVDGQADAFAGHHVHITAQQVGLQRRGVFDVPQHDASEAGLACPAQCGFGSSTI